MQTTALTINDLKGLDIKDLEAIGFDFGAEKQWLNHDAYNFILCAFADTVEQCSRCKRYRIDGEWTYKKPIVVVEAEVGKGLLGNISHSYCPECIDDFYEEL
jgi:hypothetical protein